ncbi:MAG: peptidoglycan-binding protein LysM [Bacteroidetes bacterium]|jgi:hypothetical protein|nr:peptidoglycan-binding protein LysM [Bacteroidota bacterium]
MKKLFFAMTIIAGTFAVSNNANAQSSTASTNVKITLADFITAQDGNGTTASATPGAGAEVAFSYPDAASYTVDQTVAKVGHLKVTATKSFGVKVKANAANFLKGTDAIPVSVMDIIPTAPGSGTATTVTLSAADQTILANVNSGIKTIDVSYKIPFAKAQSDILGKPSGVYNQTVTYTFSQP